MQDVANKDPVKSGNRTPIRTSDPLPPITPKLEDEKTIYPVMIKNENESSGPSFKKEEESVTVNDEFGHEKQENIVENGEPLTPKLKEAEFQEPEFHKELSALKEHEKGNETVDLNDRHFGTGGLQLKETDDSLDRQKTMTPEPDIEKNEDNESEGVITVAAEQIDKPDSKDEENENTQTFLKKYPDLKSKSDSK